MSPFVYIVLFSWIAVAFGLFYYLGPTRGFVETAVGGFLLLTPVGVRVIDGLPAIDRNLSICLGALAGTLVFAPTVLQRYRFHWLDLIVVSTLFAWGVTNMSNQGGLVQALIDWWWCATWITIPYLLARCFFADPRSLPVLSRGIVAGSLVIVPLVAYELVMSPQLHYQIYGFATGNEMERFRLGGWRPRVFQAAGLGLAIWLAGSAVVAIALLWSGVRTGVLKLPITAVAIASVALGFISRGAGAIALMVMGLGLLLAARLWGWYRVALTLPAFAVIYIATALFEADIPVRPTMLDAGSALFGEERAASLATRFHNEAFLANRAWQRPVMGWGGWGEYRGDMVSWELGHGRVLTDGLWIIVFGQRGLAGVIGLYASFLLPGVLALLAVVQARASRGEVILVLGLAIFTWIYALDMLFNAFLSPLQMVVAGALVSVVVAVRRSVLVKKVQARPSGHAVRASTQQRALLRQSAAAVSRAT